MVAGIGVTAVCYIFSAYLEHAVRFEKLMKKAERQLINGIGLDPTLRARLHTYTIVCKLLEDETDEWIEKFHANRPKRKTGVLDLNELHGYFTLRFVLQEAKRGGLISRYAPREDAATVLQAVQDLYDLLDRIPVRS